MWDTTSVANFRPYETTVFHQLCQIAHKTEFCALLPPWGEWQQKQNLQLFWRSMRRAFISVSDSRNRIDSSTEKNLMFIHGKLQHIRFAYDFTWVELRSMGAFLLLRQYTPLCCTNKDIIFWEAVWLLNDLCLVSATQSNNQHNKQP